MRRDIVTSRHRRSSSSRSCSGSSTRSFITGVSQVAFPGNANGQKVYVDGKLVGSKIIGQNFGTPVIEKNGKPKEVRRSSVTEADPRYFQSRPSATEGGAYNAAASTFSNRGPNSTRTEEADEENIKAYLELNKAEQAGIRPWPDRGEDPGRRGQHLGLEPRPRNLPGERLDPGPPHRGRAPPLAAEVDSLIAKYTSGRGLGFSGERGVNVLELNLALDRHTGGKG